MNIISIDRAVEILDNTPKAYICVYVEAMAGYVEINTVAFCHDALRNPYLFSRMTFDFEYNVIWMKDRS